MEKHGTEEVTADWFYEDQVVKVIVSHLRGAGWTIDPLPSAALKERGVDIGATRGGEALLIEAKGYPSRYYRDPARRHEQKRTNPTNQAQHWYSDALLKAIRLQSKQPSAQIAMAFPEFPRYVRLFIDSATGLEKLGIIVFFIDAGGNVTMADKARCEQSLSFLTPVNTVTAKRDVSSAYGKYRGLDSLFQYSSEAEFAMAFSELDGLTGGLPKSARSHREWWANHASNTQAVWMRHGYKVAEVNLSLEQVVFKSF
jgi:hypothetical protein